MCRTAQEPLLPAEETGGVSGILPPEFSRKAVEHDVAKEWAVHLDDVMVRRTSWHYYFTDAAAKARQVALWMGELLMLDGRPTGYRNRPLRSDRKSVQIRVTGPGRPSIPHETMHVPKRRLLAHCIRLAH